MAIHKYFSSFYIYILFLYNTSNPSRVFTLSRFCGYFARLDGWTLRGTSHGFLNVFLGLVSFRRRLLRHDGSTITANFLQHPHFNSLAVSVPCERFFIGAFFFLNFSLKRLVMQVLYKLKCFHNIKSIQSIWSFIFKLTLSVSQATDWCWAAKTAILLVGGK